jgi:AcrR family transcriptional regulator
MPEQPALSRRDRRRLNTREEILIAARELLLEVGPEALSLRQVARRTDFSPAALYTYFASRDEIIAALFAESFQRLDAYLRRVPLDLPADRRVVELGMAYLDFARENPIDLRCILAATTPEELPSSSGVGLGLGAARLIAETFEEGKEAGIFSTESSLSAAEMAYMTWALVHGMAVVSSVNMKGVEDMISADPRRALEAFVSGLTKSQTR